MEVRISVCCGIVVLGLQTDISISSSDLRFFKAMPSGLPFALESLTSHSREASLHCSCNIGAGIVSIIYSLGFLNMSVYSARLARLYYTMPLDPNLVVTTPIFAR